MPYGLLQQDDSNLILYEIFAIIFPETAYFKFHRIIIQIIFYWKIYDIRSELPFNKIHSSILVCVDKNFNSRRD